MRGSHAILAVLLASSTTVCGPKARIGRDPEATVLAYCEVVVPCRQAEDPELDVQWCLEYFRDLGVREGGWYDENGCLDSELEWLACLTQQSCEDQLRVVQGDRAAPCWDLREGVYADGCQPAP